MTDGRSAADPDVVVRPAAEADRQALNSLLRQLHPDAAGASTLPRIHQESNTFIARQDGAVAGLAVVTFVGYGSTAYGMVEEVVVDRDHRGKNIGTALVEQCLEWATGLGAEVTFVSALADAEDFYLKSGFERCTGPWLYWTARQD
jgi:N-acetylglutamate synthase-like GNAT family acetyltransferase